jgi:hypothetical protein
LARIHRPAKRAHRLRAALTRDTAAQEEFRYCLDRHGTQHFNFEQRVWIERSVAMAFTPVRTMALETLAINLLALAAQPVGPRPRRRAKPTRLIPMARDFCEQCLLGAPQEGWVLPCPAIRAWMHARMRRRPRNPGRA